MRAPFEAAGLEPEALAFLTPEWYVGVVARMHLNSFRVDIPRGEVDKGLGFGVWGLGFRV